jgi:hypothetical protein
MGINSGSAICEWIYYCSSATTQMQSSFSTVQGIIQSAVSRLD